MTADLADDLITGGVRLRGANRRQAGNEEYGNGQRSLHVVMRL